MIQNRMYNWILPVSVHFQSLSTKHSRMYANKIPYAICTSIFCLYACLSVQSQSIDLFSSEEPLKITLEFDIKQLLKGKYKEDYIQANFYAEFPEGGHLSKAVKLRGRGNFRKRYCSLPPLKLNFKNEDGEDSKTFQQSTFKLVAPCKNNETFQQYVYAEYLTYRMFNTISDLSFKVRLVDLTYIDTKGKSKPFKAFGFLIEHVDRMANRNNCREIEVPKFSQKLVNKEYMVQVSIFQYAIGNTDWLVENLHNVKLIQLNEVIQQDLFAVPYDFDYAGLVNTMYAIPHEDLGLTSVRERLFRGLCYSDAEFEKVFQLFRSKKGGIYSIIENFTQLEEPQRKHMLRFIEEFYQIIDHPASVRNNIQRCCIK